METIHSLGFEKCEASLINSGHIQDFGALCWLTRSEGKVTHASSNFQERFGIEPPLDKTATELFGESLGLRILSLPTDALINEVWEGHQVFGRVEADGILLEFEQVSVENAPEPLRLSLHSRAELVERTLAYLERASGCERVMLYEFLPDGSGAVTDELYRGAGEQFLGLRYPATDIPKVARKLYAHNRYRFIHDSKSGPVPIRANSGTSPQSLDLTHSVSRSVSPFHLEYLQNMGVATALSFPLVVDEQLTGMFSLHHSTPKFVPHFVRMRMADAAAEFLRESRVKEIEERMDFLLRFRREVELCCKAVVSRSESLSEIERLLAITEASGLVTKVDGEERAFGKAVVRPSLLALIDEMTSRQQLGIFSTDCVASLGVVPQPESHDLAGLLCIWFKHQQTNRKVSCTFMKPEVLQEVVWGSKVANYPGTSNPINSFGRWRELMREHSDPWSRQAQLAAQAILSVGMGVKV